jgi:uncharacterized membrane protein
MSDTAPVPAATKLRAPRWMWVVLISSLAVNLLGIGVIAGTFWQVRHARATSGGQLAGSLADFADTLPAERRAEIRDAIRAAQNAMAPLREQARQARREALAVFSSEPFDKEKFAAAHARVRAAALEVRQIYLRLLTDIGAKLNAAERQQFVKWREHHHARAGRRWRQEDDEQGPGAGGTSARR